ncbi:acyltransferase family protein [Ensifer canadensis]|jgi:peptidoglycan/LPS O-acetylase OafA/YrhL
MSALHDISYRRDIDGLRAVAVLSVVLYHAFPAGKLKGGFIGVDIFFVISGFLITGILLRELQAGNFSIARFYCRRALRIFPALIAVLVACLGVGWLALFSDEYAQIGKHVAGSAAFVVNLLLWQEVGYFDVSSTLKPLLHLWSLGIEEQFYIVWPVFLWLAWRIRLSFLKLSIAVALLSLASCVYFTFTNPALAFYAPPTRFWELMAGGILAYCFTKGILPDDKQRDAFSIAGLVLIVVGLLVVKKYYAFPGAWALLPVAGAVLLITAGPAAVINRTVLSNRVAVWFGLISYPLYLWHWPILAFLRIGKADGTYREIAWEARALAVLAAIALAWATYQLIEKPIRYGGKKRIWLPTLSASIVALFVAGAGVYALRGIPSRIELSPASSDVLFTSYPHPLTNEACSTVYPELTGAWSCLLSKERPADIAIIGDSHAHQYYQSLASKLPDLSVLNTSTPDCLPLSGNASCEKVAEQTLAFLKSNSSIKTVVLAGYYSVLAAGMKYENVEGQRVAADHTAEQRERFEASGNKLLTGLIAQGKRVIVLGDIPDMIFRPRDCVAFDNPFMASLRGSLNAKSIDACSIPEPEFRQRVQAFDSSLSAILSNHPEAIKFDPRPLFCDGTFCKAYKEPHFLYWNSDHLTIEGADLVIDALLGAVKILAPSEPAKNATEKSS